MNLKTYQEEAKRTCPSLGDIRLDLSHMVLGMFSEYEEFVHATDNVNKSEECSDINWYFANYCTFRGYDMDVLYGARVYSGNKFPVNISILQDYVKKYIAYGKEIDPEKEITVLKHIAQNVSDMYGYIDMEMSLQNNIDKLRVRFPDKFDEHLAKNRNLEAERAELEKS